MYSYAEDFFYEKELDSKCQMQNNIKNAVKNFCEMHNKQLKYLNYDLEFGKVLVCSKCVKEQKLNQVFKLSRFYKSDEFKNIQQENFDTIQSKFNILYKNFDQVFQKAYKSIERFQQYVEQKIFNNAINQIQQDQKNIFLDIQSSIKSYQGGMLSQEEFENEISDYFAKERQIPNENNKKYEKIFKFSDKINVVFNQLINQMKQIKNDITENFEKNYQQIQLETLYQVGISQNFNLYNTDSLKIKQQYQNKFKYVIQENELVNNQIDKKIKPLNPEYLSSINDIHMIITKNKFEILSNLVKFLAKIFPYSQNLKFLAIKNYTYLDKADQEQFVSFIKKQYFFELEEIQLEFNNSKIIGDFSQYFKIFYCLYPKLQNIKLTIGKCSVIDFIQNLTEGLVPIRKNLTSFQLFIKYAQSQNIEQMNKLFEQVLYDATNIKVLSIKFSSFQKLDCFSYLFSIIVQALKYHTQLQIFEISLPCIKQEILQDDMNLFNNIIQQQKNLTAIKINFSSYPKINSKSINLIINSITTRSCLKSLHLKLTESVQVDSQSIILLTNFLNKSYQIEELKIDFFQINLPNEDVIKQLFDSIKNLINISRIYLNFGNSLIISDISIYQLAKSLELISNQSKMKLQIKEFYLNLTNNQSITNQSVNQLFQTLGLASQLQKFKLNLFRNKKINSQPLKLLTKYISQKQFVHLKEIDILFGYQKFDSSTVSAFIQELFQYDKLEEIKIYFGSSQFDDEVLEKLIQLISQNQHLQIIDINLFNCNSFNNRTFKQFIRSISQLQYIKQVFLDFYGTKYPNLQQLSKLLKRISEKCFSFGLTISEKRFNNYFEFTKIFQDSNTNQNLVQQDNFDQE
ncbi:hypothetical protein ABPG74_007572 [Tetrahymena malaccensis]